MPNQNKLIAAFNQLSQIEHLPNDQTPRILIEIYENIQTLDEKMFDKFGEQLVRYGVYLHNNQTDQNNPLYKEMLHVMHEQLRSIGKLNNNRDIETFYKNWQSFLLYASHPDKPTTLNLAKGSFAYYFMRYKIHEEILSTPGIFKYNLVEWLICNNRHDLIDERDAKVIVEIALQMIDINKVAAYFKNLSSDLLNLAMQLALRDGHCFLVEHLLKLDVKLPEFANLVMLTLQTATAAENKYVVNAIKRKFTNEQLMQAALEQGLYRVVNKLLDLQTPLPEQLPAIALTVEIAASCGEVDFLKNLLNHFQGNKEALYQQHILPYFDFKLSTNQTLIANDKNKDDSVQKTYGKNQTYYRSEYMRAIATISYYMKKGLFTYSLTKEEQDARFLGPRKIGELRKIIAYLVSDNKEQAFIFGTIRSVSAITYNVNNRFSKYFAITHRAIIDHGKEVSTIFGITKEFAAKTIVDGKEIPLTKYVSIPKDPVYNQEWQHTEVRYFNILTNYIDTLIQDYLLLKDMSQDPGSLIAALKQIALAHYHIAQACLYSRGSAAGAEFCLYSSFLHFNLLAPEKVEETADCLAIASLTPEEYVTKFPNIFDCQTYEQLLEILLRKKLLSQDELNTYLQQQLGYNPSLSPADLTVMQGLFKTKTNANLNQPKTELEVLLRNLANQNDNVGVEELIMQGVDVNSHGLKTGYTALHYACQNKNYPLVLCLLRNGADSAKRTFQGKLNCVELFKQAHTKDEQQSELYKAVLTALEHKLNYSPSQQFH